MASISYSRCCSASQRIPLAASQPDSTLQGGSTRGPSEGGGGRGGGGRKRRGWGGKTGLLPMTTVVDIKLQHDHDETSLLQWQCCNIFTVTCYFPDKKGGMGGRWCRFQKSLFFLFFSQSRSHVKKISPTTKKKRYSRFIEILIYIYIFLFLVVEIRIYYLRLIVRSVAVLKCIPSIHICVSNNVVFGLLPSLPEGISPLFT